MTGDVLLPGNRREHASAVKESVTHIEVRTTHVEVEGIDLGYQFQRAITGTRLPRALARLNQLDILSVRSGANGNNVPRKIANHVTPGYPGWKFERLPRSVRCRDEHRYLKKMRSRILRDDAVFVRDCHMRIVAGRAAISELVR